MRFLLTPFICLLLLCFDAQVISAQGPIRFAPQVLTSQNQMVQEFSGLCESLEQITGQKIELVCKKNYADIIEGLTDSTIDLACLGPLPYVFTRQKYEHITPLVRLMDVSGTPEYTCALVHFGEDNPLNSSSSPRVALTQPYSTCGFLMSASLLEQYGLDLVELPYTYAGNHEDAALAVVRGKADLAGVKTSIAQKHANLGLTIIRISAFMPGFVLVGNGNNIAHEELERIRDGLLKIKPDTGAKSRNTSQSPFKYGLMPVEDKDYDIVRYMLQRYPIPELML